MKTSQYGLIRALWLGAGAVSLVVGIIGIVVPLLPTVPFLLLAAFCFERGSQRVHDWLVNHARLGKPIRDWRQHGAISTRSKVLAVLAMALLLLLSYYSALPLYIIAIQVVVLSMVATFILTRPAPPEAQ